MTIKRLKAPYDGYGIDSSGTVWSFKGADGKKAKVSPREDRSGYLRVNLADGGSSKNGFKEIYIHKLVAQAFLPKGTGEIHHIDANKKNNSAKNLKWATKSENATAREADKKNDSDDVQVAEWFEYRNDSDFHDTPQWDITPEGYLHARKIKLAKEGTLDYTASGGSVEWVTVDALQSLVASIRGKPVTREHPLQREVNSKTARSLIEGTVLSAWVEPDADDESHSAAYAEAIIYDERLVKDVLGGLREVSPGYDATISIVPSGLEDNFGGAKLLQTSRHANHLAITRAGRGGPDVSIRLDAADEDNMEKEKELEELKAKNDAIQKELDSQKAKNDALQAKNDAFEAMLGKKKEEDEKADEKKNDSLNEARMVAYFNERKQALDLAGRLKVQVNDSDSNHSIRSACVQKALGEKFTRLDSADAVLAAFEAVAITTPRNQPSDLSGVFRHNDSNVGNSADSIFDFYKGRG